MSEDERREFLQLAGAEHSGLEQVVRRSFEPLDLINFFTHNEQEVARLDHPPGVESAAGRRRDPYRLRTRLHSRRGAAFRDLRAVRERSRRPGSRRAALGGQGVRCPGWRCDLVPLQCVSFVKLGWLGGRRPSNQLDNLFKRTAEMTLKSINPATEEVIKEIPSFSDEQIEAALDKAAETFVELNGTTFGQRAAWMNRAAEVLEEGKAEFGKLMTLEMGKPLAAAVAEADKCAWVCRYYAEHGASAFWPTSPSTRAGAAASSLPAARAGAGRHALELPLLAGLPLCRPGAHGRQRRAAQARLQRPAVRPGHRGHPSRRAGFPAAPSRRSSIGSSRVEAVILADPASQAATLTGSEPAGSAVAAAGGPAHQEDGAGAGRQRPVHRHAQRRSEPAPGTAVKARILNNGQSCIAAKRFIVHEDVAEALRAALRRAACAPSRWATPWTRPPTSGPLATHGHAGRPARPGGNATVEMGARVLAGGTAARRARATSIRPRCWRISRRVPRPTRRSCSARWRPSSRRRTSTQAIRIANDTPFGLGAAAWTDERGRAGAASSPGWTPAPCSSTAWWRPIPASPSAE